MIRAGLAKPILLSFTRWNQYYQMAYVVGVTSMSVIKKTILLLVLVAMVFLALPAWAQGGNGGTSQSANPAIPTFFKLDTSRLIHFAQTWNNCGGATVSMGLSYFGLTSQSNGDQDAARQYLKPNWEDQNVSPWQMADYVNEIVGETYNVRAVVRRSGNVAMLETLLASDFPVIIEKGYEEQDLGWMGHYLLLMGYDQAQQIFYTYDSFLGSRGGEGREEAYDHITYYWRHFNNTFIVLYPPEREAEVQAILGDLWDETVAWQQAKATAQTEAAADPNDYWAWFNLGEAASALGEYQIATVAFRQALNSNQMPWRTLWYLHGAFEAFYQTGEFKTVLQMAEVLQAITPYIEEANYYRGLVYAAQGNIDQALFRLDRVIEFNPNFYPAIEAQEAIRNGTFSGPIQTDNG
jgi:hypothetical protein